MVTLQGCLVLKGSGQPVLIPSEVEVRWQGIQDSKKKYRIEPRNFFLNLEFRENYEI